MCAFFLLFWGFDFFFFFESESLLSSSGFRGTHCVNQAGLELKEAFLLLSAGINGLHQHAWLVCYLKFVSIKDTHAVPFYSCKVCFHSTNVIVTFCLGGAWL